MGHPQILILQQTFDHLDKIDLLIIAHLITSDIFDTNESKFYCVHLVYYRGHKAPY